MLSRRCGWDGDGDVAYTRTGNYPAPVKMTKEAAPTSGYGELADLLVCPACRSDLLPAAVRIYCSNAACSRSKAGFPFVQGVPALIDFDRSIIAEDALMAVAGRSAVGRGGSIWRRLSYVWRNISGAQPAIDSRAAAFLDCVRHTTDGRPAVLIVGGASISPNSPFRNTRDARFI